MEMGAGGTRHRALGVSAIKTSIFQVFEALILIENAVQTIIALAGERIHAHRIHLQPGAAMQAAWRLADRMPQRRRDPSQSFLTAFKKTHLPLPL
jgi:hypothetical protein